MSGLATTDVLQGQLKAGDMEMPTILIAQEDKDVNSEGEEIEDAHCKQGKQSFVDTMETQEYNFQEAKFNKKCNQGTQTESFTSSAM